MTDGYTAARRQYLAELEAIDHGLLELHQKSIALDTQDAAAIEEFESSQKALQERLSYLETSAVFWRSAKSSGHLGPNGESRATMAEMCQKELAAKQSEFQHATDAMQKSFLVTTQKREQILRLTTSLMKKRAELDWPPKSNKAES
jgi:hypothetical protein